MEQNKKEISFADLIKCEVEMEKDHKENRFKPVQYFVTPKWKEVIDKELPGFLENNNIGVGEF